jgi:succinoglycan biosynthesis transport protein ExoP
MLQVRLDEHAGDETARLDRVSATEHKVIGSELSGTSPAGELHFRQLVGILRRRSALILTIAGIGTVLAIVVGLMIPPKYTAAAQLVIEAPVVRAERAQAALDEAIDTHVALLSSRDHLQRVIESLLQDPDFRPLASDKATPEPTSGDNRGGSGPPVLDQPANAISKETTGLNELKRRLNIWLGEFRRPADTAVPRLDEFERNTKAIRERRSRVISIAFTSTSAEKAATFANRIVQLYVDGLAQQKQATTTGEMAQLDGRIVEAKYEMEAAGSAVQKALQQNARSSERTADGHLRELLRQAGNSAQHYDSLLRRQKEIRDQQEIVSSGVGIHLFAAVPNRPSSHNPILFIFPAFVLFAICGGWLAVLLEQLDRGLRSQQETADALGIPCIGLVPRLARGEVVLPGQHLRTGRSSAYAEAIRSTVAALGLAASTRSSKVVVVSSSIHGEGKTTLALSLAAYIGTLRRRVLLVDFDLRQGTARGGPNGPGSGLVEDLILQDRPLTELILRHVGESGQDYLPMAAYRGDPLALFASEQISSLIRQLRECYDCVIIDAPPVLGAIEARLLASMADKLLLVVKWGSTKRELAQNALSQLRGSGRFRRDRSGRFSCDRGDLAMAILTQVDLNKHVRYRYGDVGELLVNHRRYFSRSIESRPGPDGTGERVTKHASQLDPPPTRSPQCAKQIFKRSKPGKPAGR